MCGMSKSEDRDGDAANFNLHILKVNKDCHIGEEHQQQTTPTDRAQRLC
jgi:hypothetical protein